LQAIYTSYILNVMANLNELTESELYEKAYLLLLARDITDTATYPSGEEHPVEDETKEVPWFADTSIKINQLAKDRCAGHFTQS
jgi:hypothetical protein